MEVKILLDYEEYRDLLNYKNLYEDLVNEKENKKEESQIKKEETQIENNQQGLGSGYFENPETLVKPSENSETENLQTLFQEFVKYLENNKNPKSEQIREQISEKNNFDIDQFLNKFHERLKKKANILINELLSFDNFQISAKNEIIIDSKLIKNSDISKLIKFVLTGYPNKNLIGKQEFISFIEMKLNNTSEFKGIKKQNILEEKKESEFKSQLKVVKPDLKWYCLYLSNVWK